MRTRRALILMAAVLLALLAAAPAGAQAARHARCAANPVHTRNARASRHRAHACSSRSRVHHHHATSRPSQVTHAARDSAAAAADSRAAAIAAVLASPPCENTEVTPDASNGPVLRAAILCLINRVRAQNNELPLALNEDLNTAAEEHSRELVQADYFAHVAPDGETPVDRIRATGYMPSPSAGYVIGENLAWGTYSLSTPAAIVAAWVASPGHLANILEAQYSETGIGVSAQVPSSLGAGAPGATYAQEFGVIVE